MAKKTWVKVKRGLLIDPKHRLELGNRIWLYLYMLDIADWTTGKVIEWRDKAAADELQMPLSTIRTQRREIEEAGYISCRQFSNRQTITIKKWVNPREYSGKVYNTDEGDQNYAPEESNENTEGDQEGVNEGDQEGVNEGDQNLTPLHINHISHTTVINNTDDLFETCRVIFETKKGMPITDGRSFALMIANFEKQGVTADDYAAAIDAMDADPKYKGNKPTSYERWAVGYADKRKHPAKHKSGKNNRATGSENPKDYDSWRQVASNNGGYKTDVNSYRESWGKK